MAEIFEAKERLLSELGWSENPFVKDLRLSSKDTFMRFFCPFEAEKIVRKLAFDTKTVLLLGPKGVGKTSTLYYVFYSLPESEYETFLFKEPPKTISELHDALFPKKSGLLSAFSSFFGSSSPISREALAERLRSREKKTVFFVDEAHLLDDSSKFMYMEFKYLLDSVPNLRIVFCALGKERFPDSLVQLIGESNMFSRGGFSAEEMNEIVAHRIRAVGGRPMHPFSHSFLGKIFTEQNLLTPRYVFDELNSYLADLAAGSDAGLKYDPLIADAKLHAPSLPSSSLASSFSPSSLTFSNVDWWPSLSSSQQDLFQMILSSPSGLSMHDLLKRSSMKRKTVSNSLRQLLGRDDLERARKPNVPFPLLLSRDAPGSKGHVYFVAPKIRNLFTLH